MTGSASAAEDPRVRRGPRVRREVPELAGIDTSVAHPARVYDYWLGGKDNFAADREAAERVLAATPGLRFRVQANRAFLARAVRFLAGEAGIRQFLDIGTGIPAANNTHEVAQAVAPDSRDRLRRQRSRSCSPMPGRCWPAARRDPPSTSTATCGTPTPILRAAASTLDLSQPVALMLLGILHLIQDSEQPHQIVADLMARLPAGSYLALSHPAIDIHAAQAEAQKRYNERVSTPQTLRTREEVARFFDGLELVPPGVVYVHAWRPGPGPISPRRTRCPPTAAWPASADSADRSAGSLRSRRRHRTADRQASSGCSARAAARAAALAARRAASSAASRRSSRGR